MKHPLVLVITHNRLTYLKQLVAWLELAGYERIVMFDNASTYEPLVEWLNASEHDVVRRDDNLGPYAPWRTGYIERNLKREWLIVTDPDVVPSEDCPLDAHEHLRRALRQHPLEPKAGLALRTDDLPAHYPHRDAVVRWEAPYSHSMHRRGDYYRAPVDTTFALYRPGGYFEIRGMRTARSVHRSSYALVRRPERFAR